MPVLLAPLLPLPQRFPVRRRSSGGPLNALPSSRRRALALAGTVLVVIPFLFLLSIPVARAAGRSLSWPLDGLVIRGFEKPSGPYGEGGHQGVDIAASTGQEVRASADGTVAWVGELPRGRFITVSHAGGLRTTYLDLDSVAVSRGQKVARGQVIAKVAGTRDSSCAQPHLHFDTFLNGSPVDPRIMLKGLDGGSFVRLCPVDRRRDAGNSVSAADAANETRPWAYRPPPAGGLRAPSSGAPRGLPGLIARGMSAAWNAVCDASAWAARACDVAWDRCAFPALRVSARAVTGLARWAWNNRYVKALTVGLAAALVVAVGALIAFLLLPISAVVAAVAAASGALACIGMAIYYAATSGSDFSLPGCFLKSLTIGAIAATAVISWSALSGAVAEGWAQAGLTGTLKAALWNGVFSAVFDTGTTYVFSGKISWRRILVAFAAGFVSGAFGKVLREGIMSERFVGLFSVTAAETQSGAVSLGQTAVLVLNEVAVKLEAFVFTVKELALTFGGRIAYVAFSGSLTAGINVMTCLATHRPVTFSGVFASFLAGAAMGGIALSFSGEGVNGLLSRFEVFQEGFGVTLRRFLSKAINKSISRVMKNNLETGFRKLLKEKEVSE
jgi:murein DD-endopeptidase MepM/ murein hydrolase activator NlpD